MMMMMMHKALHLRDDKTGQGILLAKTHFLPLLQILISFYFEWEKIHPSLIYAYFFPSLFLTYSLILKESLYAMFIRG